MSKNQAAVAAAAAAPAPVFDLDPAKLGEMLVRLGAISCQAGHRTVHGTITPYLKHPKVLSPEARFLVDLLSKPVSRVVEQWYGGADNARRFEGALLPRRHRQSHD